MTLTVSGGYVKRCIAALFLILIGWVGEASGQSVLSLLFDDGYQTRFTGGNPFLRSDLFDQDTTSRGTIGGASVGVSREVDDAYREERSDGTATSIGRVRDVLRIDLPISGSRMRPELRVRFISESASALADQSQTERAEYSSERRRVAIEYAMNFGSRLRCGLKTDHSYASPSSPGTGQGYISLNLPGAMTFSVVGGSSSASRSLHLSITGTNGVVPLDYQARGARVSLAHHSDLGDAELRFGSDRVSVAEGVTRERESRFIPRALFTHRLLFLRPTISARLTGVLKIVFDKTEGRGKFLSGRSSYGNLSSYRFTATEVVVGLRHQSGKGSEWLVDLTKKSFEAQVRGYAESWPFVSFFESPLSQIENIVANGSAEVYALHVGTKRRVGDRLLVGGGVNAFRMYPELRVESWESRFLTVGRRAYIERDLSMEWIDGAAISAAIGATIWNITAEYFITQIVPLRNKVATATNGSTENETGYYRGDGRTTKTSGGQFHAIRIAWVQ